MTDWFKDRRQEFIEATFLQFGIINTQQIMDQFQISRPLASGDIQTYLKNSKHSIMYDVHAKCYVLIKSERTALRDEINERYANTFKYLAKQENKNDDSV